MSHEYQEVEIIDRLLQTHNQDKSTSLSFWEVKIHAIPT